MKRRSQKLCYRKLFVPQAKTAEHDFREESSAFGKNHVVSNSGSFAFWAKTTQYQLQEAKRLWQKPHSINFIKELFYTSMQKPDEPNIISTSNIAKEIENMSGEVMNEVDKLAIIAGVLEDSASQLKVSTVK
jgi:hypothetical protein